MSANNGTSDTTEAKRSKRLPGWFRFRPSRGHISRAALMRLTDLAIAAFNAEGDNGRLWLWFPVFFLIGIAVFFHLPADPISPAFAFATLGIAVLALGMNRSGKSAIIPAAVATFLAGMAVADWQTDRVLAPRLDRERTAQVTGEVLHVEPARSGRLRLTISPETIDGVDFAQMPERIRVSIRSGSRKPSAGERISFLARLTPPSGPVLVGGYDFSFHAFFEGRGAGGFVLGGYTMAPEQAARDTGWLRAFKQGVDRLRNWLDDRIDSALQGSEAAVAKALITGHRGAIPTAVSEDLRRAGLAHILAISGLHMALLTASVFWLVRSFLALSPSLALDFPIKKWACLAAFAAASAYLLLSGASVATQRAYIMVTIALVAVLIDRPALTLRGLGIACFLVAGLYPHSVMGPGFQMSFLAVAGLVALSEALTSKLSPPHEIGDSRISAGFRTIRLYAGGLLATSLIAGAATAPIAAYHFHTIAPFGLLGNLLAMPLVGFLVMPLGLCACLLIPFGLDAQVFALMGVAIGLVINVAETVSDLTGTAGAIGRISVLTPMIAAFAILWISIWQTRLRWLALPLFGVAVLLAPLSDRPVAVVSQSGTALLVSADDNTISILRRPGSLFEAGIWLKAFADGRTPRDKTLQQGFRCDGEGCTIVLQDKETIVTPGAREAPGYILALGNSPSAYLEDCFEADIIVNRFEAPPNCPRPKLIIDKKRLDSDGVTEIYGVKNGSFRTKTDRPSNPRPWHDPNSFLVEEGVSTGG